MSSQNNTEQYFKNIIQKYPYINFIWITDCEGVMVKSIKNNSSSNNDSLDSKILERLKSSLSYVLNSTSDQFLKTEKEKVKCITSIYDNQLLFQTKLNFNFFIHILTDCANTNIEILKIISSDINENINLKELHDVYKDI